MCFCSGGSNIRNSWLNSPIAIPLLIDCNQTGRCRSPPSTGEIVTRCVRWLSRCVTLLSELSSLLGCVHRKFMHGAWQQRGEQWCPPCHEVHHQTCGENNVRAPDHGWTVQVRPTFHLSCIGFYIRTNVLFVSLIDFHIFAVMTLKHFKKTIKKRHHSSVQHTLASIPFSQQQVSIWTKLVMNYITYMYRNNQVHSLACMAQWHKKACTEYRRLHHNHRLIDRHLVKWSHMASFTPADKNLKLKRGKGSSNILNG